VISKFKWRETARVERLARNQEGFQGRELLVLEQHFLMV
jgi:hypothetical protein